MRIFVFLLPQNEPFISTEEEGPLTQSPQCLLHFSELHGHCFTLKGKTQKKNAAEEKGAWKRTEVNQYRTGKQTQK